LYREFTLEGFIVPSARVYDRITAKYSGCKAFNFASVSCSILPPSRITSSRSSANVIRIFVKELRPLSYIKRRAIIFTYRVYVVMLSFLTIIYLYHIVFTLYYVYIYLI